jgi:RHS repeat-associated protein
VDSFTYNGDGLRVQKIDSTGTTNHVWDGQNILLETSPSDIVQAVYTLEPRVYGNLISQSRAGTSSFYLFDAVGTTRQLTSILASVTDVYCYDSFGNLVAGSGTTTNCFRVLGKLGYYYETDTQRLYVRARTYGPTAGRFLSRDPLGIEGGGSNLYWYAQNSPVRVADPSGAICVKPECGGGCVAGQSPVLKSCDISKLELIDGDYSCYLVTKKLICDKLKEYIDGGNKEFKNKPWVYNKCSDKDKCECDDYSLKNQPLIINLKDQTISSSGNVTGVGLVTCVFKVSGTVELTSGALVFVECKKK